MKPGMMGPSMSPLAAAIGAPMAPQAAMGQAMSDQRAMPGLPGMPAQQPVVNGFPLQNPGQTTVFPGATQPPPPGVPGFAMDFSQQLLPQRRDSLASYIGG
jgi:hypothetical protein